MSGEHGPEQQVGAEGGNREVKKEEAELVELSNNLGDLELRDTASPGTPQRKRNKPRFTEVELETLVREVEARKEILYGGQETGITNIDKNKAWEEVAAAVNSEHRVGDTVRTVAELKKKMIDIKKQSSLRQSATATGGGPSSVSGIVSKREGDTDKTEEQESADGGEKDDDAGEGHPAAPTPSTKHQSAGRVLTDAVLQLQRETIDAVNKLTEEMEQMRNVITEIATTLKDARG